MSVTTDNIQKLYITFFNRPADPIGLSYWTNLANANGGNTALVAASFAGTAEYKAIFTGLNSADAVNAVYLNLFGRPAEAAGLNYWAPLVANGTLTLANIATAIAAGSQGADAAAITAKLTAANQFTTNIDLAPEILGYSGDAANAVAKAWLVGVVDATTLAAKLATVDATITAAVAAHDGATTGAIFTLTSGIDTIVGTAGNDVINASYVLAANLSNSVNTLSALDSIDGGAGSDTLNVTDKFSINVPTSVSIKNVEIINFRAGGSVTADASGWTGAVALNSTQSTNVNLTAAATTNVNVSGATGAVTVTGGLAQNIVTSGAVTSTKAAGAVSVIEANQAGNAVAVDGGTNISINTAGNTGTVTVGATTKPSGTVTIVANEGPAAPGAFTGGAITVNGGTVDTVTINASEPLRTTAGVNATTTQSAVNVNGGAATTAVTINQTAAVVAVPTALAVAGVTEADTETFAALAAGKILTVGGLNFTAGAAGTTAAQTAAAFANLTKGTSQGNSVLGTYTGALTGFTSGAVTGTAAVTFTSTTANTTGVVAPVFSSTNAAPIPTAVNVTTGLTAVVAAGTAGIANGLVEIVDASYVGATANTISSVTVNGYANGVGNTFVAGSDNFIQSSALTSLSLANDAANSLITVGNKTASTLALTVNNLATGSALYLDGGTAGTYKALNITTAGKDSVANITASGVTALTVAGTNAVDLTGSTLTALKTATISGAAGVTLASVATVTDINASATSGNVVVTNFTATVGTYEGGSGNDSLTVLGNVSKAISLGAGNNTLTLSNAAAVVTAAINGGSGTTDTLVMDSGLAATSSASTVFATLVTGFERLTVNGATATPSVDVIKLGNFNYVTDAGTSDSLTVLNMASGGTLVLSGTSAHTDIVDLSVASTALNSLNIVLSAAGSTNAANSVTTTANANVTSVSIAANDTTAKVVAGTNTDTFALTAAAATTITVTGNANLTLTSANTNVTLVDASGMTGGLNYTTAGTTAETVKGGAALNNLTAHVGVTADTLIGGAVRDVITSNGGLDILTGNGGNDTFVITTSVNVNSYATITDVHVGNTIQFAGLVNAAAVFSQAQVTLASTAVFQDFANAAVRTTAPAINDAAWFQYGGNTYIVVNNVGAESSFTNGTDSIVKLTGLVDLSHTSLNTTSGTLLIG